MTEDTDGKYRDKRIGDYLVVSQALLQNAVKKQGQALKHKRPVKSIGEILVDDGQISRDEWETAVRKQRVDRLRACPVFSSLSGTELAALSSRFKEVSLDQGQQFIYQDEPDPTLYVLARGKVEVYRMDLNGKKTHIAYVEPPEPIGEMGYFQGSIRTASVRSVEPCQLLRANYQDLTHYFEHVPRVALAFTRIVEERRRATEKILHKDE